MKFETKQEVLDWYERQPRALTNEFIDSIPWAEVRQRPLDARLVPVIVYMRDVEALTDMYYGELRRTPTGRDPVISKFMERWGTEELAHGEMLNRFLEEAGVATDGEWKTRVRSAVSLTYTINARLFTFLTNLVGRKFTATHMTFGAIHELTTAQSYRRLIKLADHPVLTMILKAIMREESAHTQFYWNVARLELRQNDAARRLARFVVQNFYYPVGQGSKPKELTHNTIATLFEGGLGLEALENTINQRIQSLPGFNGLTKVTETIAAICGRNLQTAAEGNS